MATQRCNTVPEEVVAAQEKGAMRVPQFDATLGIALDPARPALAAGRPDEEPEHRLVAVGDSLTHGFQSGAIHNTRLSYPALIARELGIYDRFQHPSYDRFGGLPLNIEYLLRALAERFGDRISGLESGLAALKLLDLMDEIEDFWEQDAEQPGRFATRSHNLAIYGWDVHDATVRSAADCRADIAAPTDALFKQVVQNANERAALRVLAPGPAGQELLSPLATAVALGNDGTRQTPGAGDGIETLIVMLGANNALRTVTELRVCWSQQSSYEVDREAKRDYTVWDPVHFRMELACAVARVRAVRARHVVWATVPHVTIAPIARGVGVRDERSRYFPHYARPWRTEGFDAAVHDHITGTEARAVDAAIDLYNDGIEAAVRAARKDGLDWLLLDVSGLLDRIAHRRYIENEAARPDWWEPYVLPQPLRELDPVPDTRFLRADEDHRRTEGGLFSLDGVHPTTVMYGLIAEEYINVMKLAGVRFRPSAGAQTQIDFADLLARDSLLSDAPRGLAGALALAARIDDVRGVFARLLSNGR